MKFEIEREKGKHLKPDLSCFRWEGDLEKLPKSVHQVGAWVHPWCCGESKAIPK